MIKHLISKRDQVTHCVAMIQPDRGRLDHLLFPDLNYLSRNDPTDPTSKPILRTVNRKKESVGTVVGWIIGAKFGDYQSESNTLIVIQPPEIGWIKVGSFWAVTAHLLQPGKRAAGTAQEG